MKNWGSERLNYLVKMTQLVRIVAGNWINRLDFYKLMHSLAFKQMKIQRLREDMSILDNFEYKTSSL